MFCIKCGAKNSDEAVFCQKCGHKFGFADEEEIQIAGRNNLADNKVEDVDNEKNIFSIRPTLLFIKIGYALAVVSAFLIAALFAALSQFSIGVSSIFVVLFGLSLLLIPGYFHLKQKMVRYTLTDSKVEIDEGLVSKSTRNVPLRIIQDVTVSANLTQRLLGFGNIIIENANENDAKIVLKNINSPKKYASALLKQMRKLNK